MGFSAVPWISRPPGNVRPCFLPFNLFRALSLCQALRICWGFSKRGFRADQEGGSQARASAVRGDEAVETKGRKQSPWATTGGLPSCVSDEQRESVLTRKGRDAPWIATTWGLSPSLSLVFTPGLQRRVLSLVHCVRACSRESSKPGGKERGWWLLDCFHFLWDPGRQKFLSWKSLEKGQDSLCKVSEL